jgi:dynein heavy chain
VEVSQSYSRADWREDLKRMLRRAGADGCRCMFLFSDTEVRRCAGR